jgi:hypothetical protein
MYYVGFEDLTGVVMKSYTFWDMTPCSPVIVNRISEEQIASFFKIEE